MLIKLLAVGSKRIVTNKERARGPISSASPPSRDRLLLHYSFHCVTWDDPIPISSNALWWGAISLGASKQQLGPVRFGNLLSDSKLMAIKESTRHRNETLQGRNDLGRVEKKKKAALNIQFNASLFQAEFTRKCRPMGSSCCTSSTAIWSSPRTRSRLSTPSSPSTQMRYATER